MQYWLVKSEPDVWSIDQQKKAGNKGASWDGVRNYQAANNLKKMRIGAVCFFSKHFNCNFSFLIKNFIYCILKRCR